VEQDQEVAGEPKRLELLTQRKNFRAKLSTREVIFDSRAENRHRQMAARKPGKKLLTLRTSLW